MALGVLGSATVVLLLVAVSVVVLIRVRPEALGLQAGVAFGGLVLAVIVMAFVSRRLTRRAVRELEAEDADTSGSGS